MLIGVILDFLVNAFRVLFGVVGALLASYKTEVLFALAIGLALVLATSLFDRCLLVVVLFFTFFEGYKIGEHPPIKVP